MQLVSIEKGNVEKYQKMLQDGKKLLLKQQKLIRVAYREEDGQEVLKCYLSDDKEQLLSARREAASIRKNELEC